MQFFLVFALVIAIIIAVFAVQNAVAVIIHFFIWQFNVSLVYVILGAAAIGALTMALLGIFQQLKRQSKIREQVRRISELETELANREIELARLRETSSRYEARMDFDNTGEMGPIVDKPKH